MNELRTKYSTFKPDRLMYLEVQLASTLHRPINVSDDQLELMVQKVASGSGGLQDFAMSMLIAGKLQRADVLRALSAAALRRVETANDVHLVIRGLADGLADLREDNVARREALELYRRMFEHSDWFPAHSLAEAKHNYATLLYSNDYDDEAGRIWYQAYQEGRDDAINRAYAVYLGRADRADLARKVIAGEPITEMVLQQPDRPLPEQFATAPFIDDLFSVAVRLAAPSS